MERLTGLLADWILEQIRDTGIVDFRQALDRRVDVIQEYQSTLAAWLETQAGDVVGITDSAEVVIEHEPAHLALQGAAPELANDLKGRSPQDITLAINIYLAILQTLQVLLMLYQMAHDQPPSQTQINQIFNQATTVVNQTINMPPPPPP